MAGKGRTPDPPKLYTIKGGANRGRRMSGSVPVGRPSCPKWLSAEAKAKWKEVVPLLEEAGLLTKLDRAILSVYCQAWAEMVEATRILATQGRTCTSEAGTLKTHPAVGMQRSAMNALRLVGASLGLTPEGRLRLHVDTDMRGGASSNYPHPARVREPSRLTPPPRDELEELVEMSLEEFDEMIEAEDEEAEAGSPSPAEDLGKALAADQGDDDEEDAGPPRGMKDNGDGTFTLPPAGGA